MRKGYSMDKIENLSRHVAIITEPHGLRKAHQVGDFILRV